KEWECYCGKFKSIRYKGVVCDRCGVEVTHYKVRRERGGHIELACPVAHIWYYRSVPSRMGLLLNMTVNSLKSVLYYEKYIVIEPGEAEVDNIKRGDVLDEESFNFYYEKYGDTFVAEMGAAAIKELLLRIDLDEESRQLRAEILDKESRVDKKLIKRLEIIEAFRDSGNKPDWMILEVIPVIPPELRPMVQLDGGRFATSDLNDLYRRVINRNNRLKRLLMLRAPEIIVRNEKRMLQEAVDALFDNSRRKRAVKGKGNRPLKSISDMLKGKQGRFRQNLLGKRVDYSGRSVIVIGPELKLYQCGLPKKMAIELFKPFIMKRLVDKDYVQNIKSAKKMVENERPEVWEVLEEVISEHPVLLNRAPTLHRLGIQAFEPIIVEGKAIRLHPLVCHAYNADFDGDQMAVHVPLSIEAQMESKLIMLAPNNIFSPSSGKPITTPTQDIALGCYYLTVDSQQERLRSRQQRDPAAIEHLPIFGGAQEVHTAFDEGVLKLHSRIRFKNPDYQTETKYGVKDQSVITTTVGRVFFNEILPDAMGFFNAPVPKKKLEELIRHCYQVAGHEETVRTLDAIKDLGYESATQAGFSVGIVDMIVPEAKGKTIDAARKSLFEVESQYRKGIITDGERYNKIIDIWTHATDEVAGLMFRAMEYNESRSEVNPLFMMVDSGARGNRQQIRQLAGMRGLMAKPSGEIIERPILANFREGLSVLEYFISTHGARKGLADTALKTADSGYMTRKLVDVSQDVIVVEEDCGTLNGIEVFSIMQGDEELVPLSQRILGRTAVDDIRDPRTGEIIVAAGYEIDEKVVEKVRRADLDSVKIRSVLTCESRRGICAKCYGRNLANGRPAVLGEATGIIAAQSIGEPGTQLTMRTFHIGGTASSTFTQPEIVIKHDGVIKYEELYSVPGPDGNHIVLNKSGMLGLYDKDGRELERYTIPLGSVLPFTDGTAVKKGSTIAKWDPYNVPILSEYSGIVDTRDFIVGVTVRREIDEGTGMEDLVILEHRDEIHPQILIRDAADHKKVLATYTVPAGAHVVIEKGDKVLAGTVIAKTPRKQARTKDITGGLPRVAELFEARKPKDAAEIAKIDGIVEMAGSARGRRKLLVRDAITGDTEEHLIPLNKHIVVYAGDRVRKGQPLTEGPVVPQEILEVCGPQELQEYLVNEVQEVYRLQGVEINDKHIEIIVRQMLRKVRITEPGDTGFLWGEQVEKQTFIEVNRKVAEEGRKPAEAAPLLLGITKASLETESFISAASFQDTTRVLTDAATLARVDNLHGFKENVIMGHVIPAGTGFSMYRNIKLVPLAEPISAEELLGDQLATVPGSPDFSEP
ncbi:MAG: DNA-directed RNA polymerase subunit beta', partial [Lentisphaerae bacterium]|nr:DNA-directed RNA polymerase subunit beta' [Lentisphaerota bacterium]